MQEISCDKEQYKTLPEVHAAISGLNKRGVKGLRSYKCRWCEQYHISSAKAVPFRRRKVRKDKNFNKGPKPQKKKFIPIKVTAEDLKKSKAADQKKEPLSIFEGLQRFIKPTENGDDKSAMG